ncbi:homeobox protein orthopedia-like [Lepisosteus oculatus]|uniref:homeobox protein orthopedia-like n=1 Tax=Lepisosteus oculatus TaxID=7918 RepID=UPI003714897A
MALDRETEELLSTILSLEQDYCTGPVQLPSWALDDGFFRLNALPGPDGAAAETRLRQLDEKKENAPRPPSAAPAPRSGHPGAAGNSPVELAKGKRRKTLFTKEQTDVLKRSFEADPYPDYKKRTRLSELTGIQESRIQVWFQNRRARHLPRIRQRNWPYWIPGRTMPVPFAHIQNFYPQPAAGCSAVTQCPLPGGGAAWQP